MNNIEIFKKWIDGSSKIVFFGGAGVSTESGIPDFRSVDGLYHQHYKYPPETILSHRFFVRYPEEFFEFYRNKLIPGDVKPNKAHLKLTELESTGKLKAVVTQNIDGLHQMAGSRNVFELHGSINRNHCTRCGKSFSVDVVKNAPGIPRCECGGVIKPDVVLYEESLDEDVILGAIRAISSADMLIIGGTSLNVYPAASFVDYFSGGHLVLINLSETSQDGRADLIIREPIAKVFGSI